MKILIIGTVGSGKTTLAKKLGRDNNVDYYEIDSIVHDDIKKRKRSNEEQQKIIKKIDKNDSWIIEGVLRNNLNNLLDISDLIIYLDIPLNIRKRRILFRYIKQKLRLEKCGYEPTFEMLKMMFKWTSEFEVKRIEFENRINKYKDKLIILSNVRDVNKYCL